MALPISPTPSPPSSPQERLSLNLEQALSASTTLAAQLASVEEEARRAAKVGLRAWGLGVQPM